VRVSSLGTAEELVGKAGWYFDLPASGERIVIPNIFQGNVLIGTVRIPDASDICKPTGRGFIIALNPFTGGRLDRIFFDVNGDGEFDDEDNTMYNGESTIISGIGFDSSPNAPIFIGNVMQVVKDDGIILSILTQGRAPEMVRTSWHEIINQQ
jgi:type IV pilus assembly protein PilY1